ncbi:hypothetical protein D9619_013254 [Psilocybe cf. subviscida]|uniref:Uncharacterized protein n=1 Tax=Psilocybe cf. subviscida TaxID=2480587 RepID=A0A8H5BSF8_9AGAR|nr:hypothetical protein D9619_013254 [Psilocybe cf. subviscida]
MSPQGQPQGPFSPQMQSNRNITMDFTKGIATEVRYLLAEIGKLRDERRQLQYEISELMAVRSKFSPNGEFQPEWRPPPMDAPPMIEAPPPPEDAMIPPARPGWRVVHKRPDRKARTQPKQPAAIGPPPVAPGPEPPKPEAPAWAQWRPNPLLAPTPVPQSQSPPPRAGLFGPSTPPPK